jgi:NAD(P)-dependent dehydrogenase (short-subunit alcohol dehydrogenase family)
MWVRKSFMRLKGKVAIVTGGAHGLGEADVRLFVKEGAKVVIADILIDEGQALARSLREAGHDAVFAAVDVTSDQDWQALMELTLNTYSKLDVLVNNAGIGSGAVEDLNELDGWHRLMAVNSTSVFLGSRRAAEIMVKAAGGSIINISSVMGIVGHTTGHLGYFAAKASVRNQTKAMAVRLAPYGVRVNSIHPGFFPRMMKSITSNIPDEVLKHVPMGRVGEPLEIAYGALFLASDESSFMTGAELIIDGGYTAQ